MKNTTQRKRRKRMSREDKRKTYISKSIIQAVDHLLDRVTEEDIEIVIKIKAQKEEGNEIS
jgi:hypothetical protein